MSDLKKLIEGLDERKKAKVSKKRSKASHYPTPGLVTTEILLLDMGMPRCDKKTALSALQAIKDGLKK